MLIENIIDALGTFTLIIILAEIIGRISARILGEEWMTDPSTKWDNVKKSIYEKTKSIKI